ncbi:MAG: hypothetical protein CVT70_13250 [Alphaproteobacteria bacterium HGW-Alphaproteobacteria-1]|jgi:uncharacterized membrane protein|nr:MAG: hypothetical protein CVT70_13250 [Alphaproteobacteria bacterium HGW-Alphaproteobacteria-1]
MAQTIGNPLTWLARAAIGAGHEAAEAHDGLSGSAAAPPAVRALTEADLREALRKGLADFTALRSDVIFLMAIYPVIGLVLTLVAFHGARLEMVFPLAGGFILLGPVVATGLYEMSRQRESGAVVGWGAAFDVMRTRVIVPVIVLGAGLVAVFLTWLYAAHVIHALTLGAAMPDTVGAFLREVLTTGAGWLMIVLGMGVGLGFAALVLATSFVAFPMLINRRAGVVQAVLSSLDVARASPAVVARWGLIVGVAMFLGALPAFLGLALVLPVLGHATWHLYRAAVPQD